jgi:hypothetical protein
VKTVDIDTTDQQTRLDWMRAEFRAAQQRRYDKRPQAPEQATVADVKPIADTEPSTLATPVP